MTSGRWEEGGDPDFSPYPVFLEPTAFQNAATLAPLTALPATVSG
jgi:hypothetical protein